ncbi:hypothetical protein HMPREF2097_00565 [Enterococcus faecalis 918]|nr:hypothetical protein HMPREF2097_00565 [Enterococcus faecalis 918]
MLYGAKKVLVCMKLPASQVLVAFVFGSHGKALHCKAGQLV